MSETAIEQPTETKTQEPTVKILLVFVRETHVKGTGKKKWEKAKEFLLVTREEFENKTPIKIKEEDERSRTFSGNLIKYSRPGMIYELEARASDGRSIFVNTAKFIGLWPVQDDRLRWEAVAEAEKNHADAQKYEADSAKHSLLAEVLDPLRKQYHRLPYMHQKGFLAAVLYHITK